ncbi:integral membrane protein [Dendryphion nanum]|uniref:Integral membrane protein n=1 Tax=Dendryphion nanum TaxID=256645 RepID=A0A9P9CYZ3_9PLEO|nr:integral membrane protein [Dendryphion nanum]
MSTLSWSLSPSSPLTSALGSTASTNISKQCPLPDLCFSLNIPDSSLQSGTGDFFLQITGPTKYAWISIAQGEQMDGAHYFVMYTAPDSKNVTVSTRIGKGYSPPIVTQDTHFQLLEGSGVLNGTMTANIKCSNCTAWSGGSMSLTKASTSWIWAHLTATPLSSSDTSLKIRKHDAYGSLAFNSTSHGGADLNPFVRHSAPIPPNTPPTSTSKPKVSHGPPKRVVIMYTAHAILACLAWAFVFPLGGIMIRLLSFPGLLWTHAYLQIAGFCMYTAAIGLGIPLSNNPKFWRMENKHVLIGLIIFGLFFLQIFTGYLHHVMFVKKGGRTIWSMMHLWSGRICVTLGIINGGFGFQITHKGWESWEVKTYTVFGVLVWIVYVASIVIGENRRRKRITVEKEGGGMLGITAAGASTSQSEIESGMQTPQDGQEKEVRKMGKMGLRERL